MRGVNCIRIFCSSTPILVNRLFVYAFALAVMTEELVWEKCGEELLLCRERYWDIFHRLYVHMPLFDFMGDIGFVRRVSGKLLSRRRTGKKSSTQSWCQSSESDDSNKK